MLSKRLYTFFHYGSLLGCYLGMLPATFCLKSLKIITSETGRKRLRRHAYMQCFLCLFHVCQLVRFYILKRFESFNTVLLYAVPAFIMLEAFYLISFREEDSVDLMNGVFFYARYMNKEYLPAHDPDKSKLSYLIDLSVISVLCGVLAVCPLNIALVFLFPRWEYLPASILPEDCPLLIYIYVAFIFPAHILLVSYVIAAVFAMLIFIYAVIIVPVVLFEFPVNRNHYRSLGKLRKPPTLYHTWRTVQVLQMKVNNLLGIFMIPTQTLCLKVAVTCAFMLNQHGSEMRGSLKVMLYIWGIGCTQFWCSVLLLGGYMHLFGARILSSWKLHDWPELSQRERKFMRKFVASCQPFQLCYGKTYVIRRLSVLRYIRQLLRGIFRALAALGHSVSHQ